MSLPGLKVVLGLTPRSGRQSGRWSGGSGTSRNKWHVADRADLPEMIAPLLDLIVRRLLPMINIALRIAQLW